MATVPCMVSLLRIVVLSSWFVCLLKVIREERERIQNFTQVSISPHYLRPPSARGFSPNTANLKFDKINALPNFCLAKDTFKQPAKGKHELDQKRGDEKFFCLLVSIFLSCVRPAAPQPSSSLKATWKLFLLRTKYIESYIGVLFTKIIKFSAFFASFIFFVLLSFGPCCEHTRFYGERLSQIPMRMFTTHVETCWKSQTEFVLRFSLMLHVKWKSFLSVTDFLPRF